MAEHDYSRDEVPHVPGKHRGPRFTWSPAYEVTFFRSLCESVQLGLREGMTFKAEAWDRAAQALIDKHNAYANKGHLINKSDNARKKFRMWRSLREHPDFLYNPSTKTITGTEEAWRKHIEREPLSRSLKGRPFEYEDFYEILFPDVIGTGGAPKRVTTKKRKAENSMVGDTDRDQTVASADGTPGPAMVMLSEATYGNNSSSSGASASSSTTVQQGQQAHQLQSQAAHRQSTASTAPAPSPILPQHHTQQQTQRPTSTTLPPRSSLTSSLTSTSVLTPPDETPQITRQRFLAPEHSSQPPPPSTYQPPPRPNSGPDKRRKGKADGYLNVHPPRPQPLPPQESYHHHPGHQGGHTLVHHHSPTAASYPHPPSPRAQPQIDGILALAEAIRQIQPAKPAYTEQAVEVFLDNFSDEDKDFQIKIADKLFADEHKSMVFVKMSEELRKHWVKRMKDVHFKQT